MRTHFLIPFLFLLLYILFSGCAFHDPAKDLQVFKKTENHRIALVEKQREIRSELASKIAAEDQPKIAALKSAWQDYVAIKLGRAEKFGKTSEIIKYYWQNQIGGLDMTVAAWLDKPDDDHYKLAETLFRKYNTELTTVLNQLNPIHQAYSDYEATVSKQLKATQVRIKNDFEPPLTLHKCVSILIMDGN